MNISVEYSRESELMNALVSSKNVGIGKYWFDVRLFDEKWFQSHLERALETAERRYSPDLNVELPIAKIFDGLGRLESFDIDLRIALREVRQSFKWYNANQLIADDDKLKDVIGVARSDLKALVAEILAIEVAVEVTVDFEPAIRKCDKISDDLQTERELL